VPEGRSELTFDVSWGCEEIFSAIGFSVVVFGPDVLGALLAMVGLVGGFGA
jgi:hypothetical protein